MPNTILEPEETCPETSDGYHCNHWHEGTDRCCACGQEPLECGEVWQP